MFWNNKLELNLNLTPRPWLIINVLRHPSNSHLFCQCLRPWGRVDFLSWIKKWYFVNWVSIFGPKWVRLAPKGTHSAKMYWTLIWKSPGFVPFEANLTHFGSKSGHPVLLECLYKLRVCWLSGTGMSDLDPNWVRLASNGTNPGHL